MTPEAMYWLSEGSFSFVRAFLPILLSLALFMLWFVVLVALKKWCLPLSVPDDNRTMFHKMADNIVCRLVNFLDSIWRYQFIAILMICIMQFIAYRQASPTQDQKGGLAASILVVLAGVAWTVAS